MLQHHLRLELLRKTETPRGGHKLAAGRENRLCRDKPTTAAASQRVMAIDPVSTVCLPSALPVLHLTRHCATVIIRRQIRHDLGLVALRNAAWDCKPRPLATAGGAYVEPPP